MNTLEKIFKEDPSGLNYSKEYASYMSKLLGDLDFQAIDKVIEVFLSARAKDKTIYFVGNGGSAATSSHICEDLAMGTYISGKIPFRAISLTDNAAYMTALGNDEGYENIFTGQMRNMFNPGDVLVGISASGNSPNVIKAIEYANNNEGISISFVGFNGGKMKDLSNYCIQVDTMKGEYGPVEDMHLILGHIICTFLKYVLINE
jgi:D-sedoheptulose 7-phosphate isomerase